MPYGLRKIESCLVQVYGRDDVVIADARHLDRYIDDDTEVVSACIQWTRWASAR